MDSNLIDVLKYLTSGIFMGALWIWKESSKGATKESNIQNAIEALKLEISNSKHQSYLQLQETKKYFEDKINNLQIELKEQKEEKKMMEERIYKKVDSVERTVTETSKDINHIKIMITKIATLQKLDVDNI